jgi:Rrf2 family protein
MKIPLAQSLSYHHDNCHFFSLSSLMWLSSTAQQAVYAVLSIAQLERDEPVRVDEIASMMGSPRNYLSKTLHLLTRAGVLKSERGPRGGFRLASPPDRLSLARIIAPFEPPGKRRCLVGRASCSDARPCPAHHRWKEIAGSVDDFFKKTTVADLIDQTSHASAETHAVLKSLRNSNRRSRHGSAA